MNIENITIIYSEGAVPMPSGVFDAKHLIDGKWTSSASCEIFKRKSPLPAHW